MDTPLLHPPSGTPLTISREVNWIIAINHWIKTKIGREKDKVGKRDEEKMNKAERTERFTSLQFSHEYCRDKEG